MSSNYREISRRVTEEMPQYSTGASLVDDFVKSLKKKGLLPQKLSESQKSETRKSELNLNNEWLRQTRRFIELGFHKELGLSKAEYIKSLLKFTPQPESWKGRFDIPVIVERRIDPKRQTELAGFSYYLDGLNVSDWAADPKGYKTPDESYTTWMQDGKKNLKKSVFDVRRDLAPDERGATLYDGISLLIQKPNLLKDHYIDLPGTRVGSDDAPFLSLWGGGPEVYYYGVDDADSHDGSASCGRVEI